MAFVFFEITGETLILVRAWALGFANTVSCRRIVKSTNAPMPPPITANAAIPLATAGS
jgi:hypothetical protein